jgi:hypothetical protein
MRSALLVVGLISASLACLVRSGYLEHAPAAALERAGGHVIWDGESMVRSPTRNDQGWLASMTTRLRAALFSHVTTASIGSGSNADDRLVYVGRLRHLKQLVCPQCDATDVGLENLAGLDRLEELLLQSQYIGDDGMARLSRLNSLQVILIFDTPVTDNGLRHLYRLKTLRRLELVKKDRTEGHAKRRDSEMKEAK